MSEPHPPRPEDQPAQQPSAPSGPRTMEIPVVTPETDPYTQPATQTRPGPAFSTEANYSPGGATAVVPAPGPPPPAPIPAAAAPPVTPVSPAQMPPPAFPPHPVPPQQVWPQPVAPPAAPTDDLSGQVTGPVGFAAGPTAPPPGSTSGPATGQFLPTGPGGAPGPGQGGRVGRTLTRLAGGGRAEDLGVLTGLALGVLGLVLLEIGLSGDFGSDSLYDVVPTWSVFATVAALLALLPLVLRWVPGRPAAGPAWRIGAAGAAGLAAFWVLVALPLAASDRGFWLAAAVALVAGAVWLAPGRPVGTGAPGSAT